MLLKIIGNWVNDQKLFASDYFEGSPMSCDYLVIYYQRHLLMDARPLSWNWILWLYDCFLGKIYHVPTFLFSFFTFQRIIDLAMGR